MKPTSLQLTEKRNIQPERWMPLKSRALPPMAACKGSPIESSLRRMSDLPKLATRRKGDAEVEDGGLTGQLKRWATSLPKLTPGSKHRSESPAMESSEDQQKPSPERAGGSVGEEGGGSSGRAILVAPLSILITIYDISSFIF